ncbi:MAG TPA: hypothetical protein VGQ13_10125 [Nitrososphaera sp.]|jgi:hypothetical protein|nr:hypothetical protein [Nitrososphaera sp.]
MVQESMRGIEHVLKVKLSLAKTMIEKRRRLLFQLERVEEEVSAMVQEDRLV